MHNIICPTEGIIRFKIKANKNFLLGTIFSLCDDGGWPVMSLTCSEFLGNLIFVYNKYNRGKWDKIKVIVSDFEYDKKYDVSFYYGKTHKLIVNNVSCSFDEKDYVFFNNKSHVFLFGGMSESKEDLSCKDVEAYDLTIRCENGEDVIIGNKIFDSCDEEENVNTIIFFESAGVGLEEKIRNVFFNKCDYKLSGTRSRIFEHNGDFYKLKGGGYKGKLPLKRMFRSGNLSPYYDFDGNYYYDKSNNMSARFGTMSRQQAFNEKYVSDYLINSGYKTYKPCAYGSYGNHDETIGYFICLKINSLSDDDNRTLRLIRKGKIEDFDKYIELSNNYGAMLHSLHNNYYLFHHHANATTTGGTNVQAFDWHTAIIGKYNPSALSKAMYMIYDLRVYTMYMSFKMNGKSFREIIISKYLEFDVSDDEICEFNNYVASILYNLNNENNMGYCEKYEYLNKNTVARRVLEYAERL